MNLICEDVIGEFLQPVWMETKRFVLFWGNQDRMLLEDACWTCKRILLDERVSDKCFLTIYFGKKDTTSFEHVSDWISSLPLCKVLAVYYVESWIRRIINSVCNSTSCNNRSSTCLTRGFRHLRGGRYSVIISRSCLSKALPARHLVIISMHL